MLCLIRTSEEKHAARLGAPSSPPAIYLSATYSCKAQINHSDSVIRFAKAIQSVNVYERIDYDTSDEENDSDLEGYESV
jgi:hypothetical protein